MIDDLLSIAKAVGLVLSGVGGTKALDLVLARRKAAAEAAKLEAEVRGAQAHVDGEIAAGERDDIRFVIDTLKQQVDMMKDDVLSARADALTARQEVAAVHRENLALRKENRESHASIELLQSEGSAKQLRIEILEATVAQQQRQLTQAQAQLHEALTIMRERSMGDVIPPRSSTPSIPVVLPVDGVDDPFEGG